VKAETLISEEILIYLIINIIINSIYKPLNIKYFIFIKFINNSVHKQFFATMGAKTDRTKIMK